MAASDNAPLVVRVCALTDLNDAVLGLGQPITQDLRLLLIACRGDTRDRKQKNDGIEAPAPPGFGHIFLPPCLVS
jgi:hypothetical protein